MISLFIPKAESKIATEICVTYSLYSFSPIYLIIYFIIYLFIPSLRTDFTSNFVHGLAFGTSKLYTAPYDKINHGFVNLFSNFDMKSGLSLSLLSNQNLCIISFVPQSPLARDTP